MKQILVLAQATMCFLFAYEAGGCLYAQSSMRDKYAAAIEKLDSVIRYEVALKDLPALSISLVDGSDVDSNGIVWAQGYGYQDRERRIPATADTVYRVGSISKLFTDVAIMQLVEQGLLDLDVPIQQYLPDFQPNNPYGTPQTLRHLMTHRSGLVRESPVGNYFDPTEPSLAETVASLTNTTLVLQPNTKTKYSNAAIAVVGAVLEKKLQQSHPTCIQRSILDPLGMRNSSFVELPSMRPRLATGWMWTYDDRRFEAPKFMLGTGPAGNMLASVTDLAKFVKCLFNDGRTSEGQLLNPRTLADMISPTKDASGESTGYGLGFRIQDFEGNTKIGHGGAVYGFSAQLEALPHRKLGVVIATSLDASNGVINRISDYALRLMLATQEGVPLPNYQTTARIPAERVPALLGKYREVGGERFAQISELNGRVTLDRGTFRNELRVSNDDGSLITDDAIGWGLKVTPEGAEAIRIGDQRYERLSNQPPKEVPERWRGLIGEYGWDHNTLYILEEDGKLFALIEWFYYYPLTEVNENVFHFPNYGLYHDEGLTFTRNADGFATEVNAAQVVFKRREVGTKDGETFKIKPVKPIEELREEALAAKPPVEAGDFRNAELLELSKLDPTLKFDIRYATTNNFMGAIFYQQPLAFMQRPAAEAVVRANASLKHRGLGLLIHDAYRPWHVTKMFWDATPNSLKDFVANPANGSRHNRGCAVDLSLYSLETGEPIQMVAGYDEFSPRSYPLYPGGTSQQRWYRDLLRRTMEAEGFTVYEYEWWHFDYKDWKTYRIGNQTFEQLQSAHGS